MNELLTARGLQDLAHTRAASCVSIVVPTGHTQLDAEGAKLSLKNLLAATRDELSAAMRPHDVDALLQPAEDALVDDELWRETADGVALFLTPSTSTLVNVRGEVAEMHLVGDRFAIAPLLHAVVPDASFHVLALSRNHTQVFTGDRFTLRATKIEGLPDSLDDALWYESRDNLLNRHGGSHFGAGGRPTSVVHGSSASDDRKNQFERYVRKVDDAVCAALGAGRLPLLIAAVDREITSYTSASRYPNVLGGIAGNPEHTSLTELHAGAWARVRKELDASHEAAIERYRELHGTGWTETDPVRLVAIAAAGGIDTLFVSRTACARDDATSSATNVTVADTMSTRGTVVPLDDLRGLSDSPSSGDAPLLAAIVRAGHQVAGASA